MIRHWTVFWGTCITSTLSWTTWFRLIVEVTSLSFLVFPTALIISVIFEHVQYWLTSFTNFNAQFLFSLTICMLHYNPGHVSSINMPIFRRTNCIMTSSDIVTLCTVQYREWRYQMIDNTICPPEDGHVNARNMSRIVM